MDKKNMYYIVREGTNKRLTNSTKEPLICTERGLYHYTDGNHPHYEPITIAEYELRFMESKTDEQDEQKEWNTEWIKKQHW